MAWWNFFVLSVFDQQDKTQPSAKFKTILYVGFWATLNFQNLKVALNSMFIFFETLPKLRLILLIKIW